MFSLEKLSKIKGAQEQTNIMSFFDVLDQYISDGDVAKFSQTKNAQKTISISQLRKDEVVENINNQIINSFPQEENNYLKIPKVIE